MKINSKDQVRDSILTSITNGFQQAGITTPNTGKSSHFYISADAFATTITSIQNDINQDLIKLDPQSLTGKDLDDYATSLKFSDGSTMVRKQPSNSTGYIIFKQSNITQKTYIDSSYQLVDQAGRAYHPITSGYYNDNAIIQIVSSITGSNTNIPAETQLVWRQLPLYAIPNVKTLSNISGGTDTETDDVFRTRILNAKIYAPAGSSQDIINFVNNNIPLCDNVYVYPVANGPASCHIALSSPPQISLNRSRTVPIQAITQANQLVTNMYPQTANFVIQSVQDNKLDMILKVDSNSFLDTYPLPVYNVNYTSLLSIDSTYINIMFNSPVDWTHYANPASCNISISWISPYDFTIVNVNVISFNQTGSVGNYNVSCTLNAPLSNVNGHADVGSYIFPTMSNASIMLKSVLNSFAQLGASEKYHPSTFLYNARTKRYPATTSKLDCKISYSFINNLMIASDATSAEIAYMYDHIRGLSVNFGTYPISSGTINILNAPYIYTPYNIAFYNINALS